MITVESHGSTREQGRIIGESIRDRRDELEAAAWKTICDEYGLSREFAFAEAERLTQALREHAPQAYDELSGIVEGAAWSEETASVYNHWNYIVQQPSLGKYVPSTEGIPVAEECTARLALGEITATGQPIMAKKRTTPISGARTSTLCIRRDPPKGTASSPMASRVGWAATTA